jgi:Phage tail assembly chaperone
MAKVRLDLDPKEQLTFSRAVSIPTPDGKPLKITFEFRYRDRVEMADMMERHAAVAREQYDLLKGREQAIGQSGMQSEEVEKLVLAAIERDVDVVLDSAISWNVDGWPLDRETLRMFFRRYPGAASAIHADYRVSLIEGRLGN